MFKLQKVQNLLEHLSQESAFESSGLILRLRPEFYEGVKGYSSVQNCVSFALGILDDLLDSDYGAEEIAKSLFALSCTHKNDLINKIIACEIKKAISQKYSFELSERIFEI